MLHFSLPFLTSVIEASGSFVLTNPLLSRQASKAFAPIVTACPSNCADMQESHTVPPNYISETKYKQKHTVILDRKAFSCCRKDTEDNEYALGV